MPTLRMINVAAADAALRERFYAAAAKLGVPDGERWVIDNMRQLATQPVNGGGMDTVASVYEYAHAMRADYLTDARAIPPGENEGAVTDAHIEWAINALRSQS